MGFEVFTREITRTIEPRVTITSMGRIALNRGASDILAKGKTELVLLLWNKDTKQYAVQPITKKDSRAYKLRAYGPKGNGLGFSCVTFLNYIKYDWSDTRSFDLEYREHEKLMIFTIPEEHLQGR